MAIGLFGGSFNPPHEGHRGASLLAMRRLKLDRVWWLVTPGNPLKDNAALPSLGERIAAAQAVAAHPHIVVSGVEAEIGVSHTCDVLDYLKLRCPGVAFVWIMGADNLASFHTWSRWREILRLVPVAVIDRPGATFATGSPAARLMARNRVPERLAATLPHAQPPAWCFIHGPRSPLSSTAIRTGLKRPPKDSADE